MRKINESGLQLIRSFEGCRLNAYPDPASPLAKEMRKTASLRAKDYQKLPGDPWTVGWGSTGADPFNGGKPIGPGTTWTQEQCDKRNVEHLEEFCAQVVPLLKVDVNDNQFAALVSFAYNVGVNALKKSTLLIHTNAKKWDSAAEEFLKWNKAGGQVMAGLTKRREAEKRLFLTPDPNAMCLKPI
jgi:lysozyme